MHALAQLISLPSLDSAINFSPLIVAADTPLLDVIALMSQHQPQASSVLVVESFSQHCTGVPRIVPCASVQGEATGVQVVGWFTEQDVVRLVSSGVDFKKALVSEVMDTSVVTLKRSELHNITSVLSLLRQHQLPLLAVTDGQGQLVGIITHKSICQALEIYRLSRADGEYRWLLNTDVPGFAPNSSFGYVGSCTDIKEHHSVEEKLAEAKEQLQTVLDAAPKFVSWVSAVKEMNRQLIYEMTDRLLIEEQLRQSQEMLQLIMDNIPQSIFWKDTDSVYLGCNRNLANKIGFENLEDIVGKTDYDLVCKEEADFYRESDARIMETDTPEYRTITPHLRKDGKQAWLEVNKVPLHDAEGNVMGILGTFEDITARKRSEESLRLRDRAIAASSNGIMIADATMPDWPIIYANPAFEQITGYSTAEVIGKNSRFLQGADTNQPELTKLRDAIAQAKGCTVVLRNYRKDGTLFWNELSISPVYDTNSKFTHYIGIQTDITERKQAEVALLVLQERLQYLLSSSPGVIYSSKVYGHYGTTFMSENAIAMFGYEAREFVEDSSFWASHVHPFDLPQVFAEMSKLLSMGQHQHEYRFLHKDGTYRWVYAQAKLVQDDAGNPLEFVGYLVDITERKQLEEELRGALQKEKELSELKSRFVSMTSHEFRTPLSTILSSSELLEHYRHKWTEEKQLSHLHRIQTAVKHMTEMLNNVLIIGKMEAGKLDFVPASLDLVQYCHFLVEELQLNVNNQHAINFSCQYESMPCYMDEKLLGHILSNLLSNAIKYSPTGSTVNFTLTCEQGQAVFEIQDHGIGIPPSDLPRMFESFYRATNVGNIQGTGLGLAIVKKCVDVHNGKIAMTSVVGVETTFTVSLPLNN